MKESIPLQLITGVGSVLTGLLYLLQVFGPTETEIVTWGKSAILAGIVYVLWLWLLSSPILNPSSLLVFWSI